MIAECVAGPPAARPRDPLRDGLAEGVTIFHSIISLLRHLQRQPRLSILIYHQVLEQRDPMRPAEPDTATFRWQMDLVKRYYRPLALDDAVRRLQNGSLPAGAIAVTFDDGYRNNLEVAAPILRALGIPATVFATTAYAEGDNMWNDRVIDLIARHRGHQLRLDSLNLEPVALTDWPVCRRLAEQLIGMLKYRPSQERKTQVGLLETDNGDSQQQRPLMMSPTQLRKLHAYGLSVGAHTHSHPILKGLPDDEQQQEIQRGKALLEQWCECPVSGFAYPNGKSGVDYDSVSRRLARELGFNYAVTTDWGVSTDSTDRFLLRRFTPWGQHPRAFHQQLVRNQLGWLG